MQFHCLVHTIFPSVFTAAIGSGSRQRLCGIENFSCNPRICVIFDAGTKCQTGKNIYVWKSKLGR